MRLELMALDAESAARASQSDPGSANLARMQAAAFRYAAATVRVAAEHWTPLPCCTKRRIPARRDVPFKAAADLLLHTVEELKAGAKDASASQMMGGAQEIAAGYLCDAAALHYAAVVLLPQGVPSRDELADCLGKERVR